MEDHCLLPQLIETTPHKTMQTSKQITLKPFQDNGIKSVYSLFRAPNTPTEKQKENRKSFSIYKTYSLTQNSHFRLRKKGIEIVSKDNEPLTPCKPGQSNIHSFQADSQFSRNTSRECNKGLNARSIQRFDNSFVMSYTVNSDISSIAHLRANSFNDKTGVSKGSECNFNQTNRTSLNFKQSEAHYKFLSARKEAKHKMCIKPSIRNNIQFASNQDTTPKALSPQHATINSQPKIELIQFSSKPSTSLSSKLTYKVKPTIKLVVNANKDNVLQFKGITKGRLPSDNLLDSSSTPNEPAGVKQKDTTYATEDEVPIVKEIDALYQSQTAFNSKYHSNDTQDTYASSIQSDIKKRDSCGSDQNSSIQVFTASTLNSKQTTRLNRHYNSQLSKISEGSYCKMLQDRAIQLNKTERCLIKADEYFLIEACSSMKCFIKKAKSVSLTHWNYFDNISECENNEELSASVTAYLNESSCRRDVNRGFYTSRSLVKSSPNKKKDNQLQKPKQHSKGLKLFIEQSSNSESNHFLDRKRTERKECLLQKALPSLKSRSQCYFKERPRLTKPKVKTSFIKSFSPLKDQKLFESDLINYSSSSDTSVNLNHHHNIHYLFNKYFDVDIPQKLLTQMYFYDIAEYTCQCTLFTNFKELAKDSFATKMVKRKKWINILTLMPVCGELTYLSSTFYNQYLHKDHLLPEEHQSFDVVCKSLSNSNFSFSKSKRNQNGTRSMMVDSHNKGLHLNSKDNIRSKRASISKLKGKGLINSLGKDKCLTSNHFKRLSFINQRHFCDTLLTSHFMQRKKRNKAHNSSSLVNHDIDRTMKKKLSLLDNPSFLINMELPKARNSANLIPDKNALDKIQMINKTFQVKENMLHSLKSHVDTVLFYIKDHNYIRFKEAYEQFKIDKETKDQSGNSMLSLAVQGNSIQIANYLLDEGADPNNQNIFLNTPLHYALMFHYYEIADMLIRRGANENVMNLKGLTPWQCVGSENLIN